MATPLSEMTDTSVQLDDPTTYLAGPPHAFFDYLRQEEPVHWHASPNYAPGFWVVTKYADVIGAFPIPLSALLTALVLAPNLWTVSPV